MKFIKISINQIRQYIFCPRVVFFEMVQNIIIHKPSWVGYGANYHEKMTALLKRNNLSRLGFKNGNYELKINTMLNNDNFNYYGIVDGLIVTTDQIIPIELKNNYINLSKGHELQLTAYGVLAQAIYNKPFNYGLLIYGSREKVIKVTPKLQELETTVSNIEAMLSTGKMPHSSATIQKCSQCEYLNYCNDRF
jgi:CRISPR-associated exonuclease Cas4